MNHYFNNIIMNGIGIYTNTYARSRLLNLLWVKIHFRKRQIFATCSEIVRNIIVIESWLTSNLKLI